MRDTRLICVFLVLVLSGCARLTHDIGEHLDRDSMNSIPSGSHYSDVLHAFGPPTKMSALPAGMVFQYEYVELNERQYGLILPGEIGKWIKAVYSTATANAEVMLLVFDDDGNLLGSDEQAWSGDAGAGMSVTLLFSAGSFTDTQQYEDSASKPLEWGRGLILPPLNALNSRQNLETGANGVQLTTNSEGVGQQTLELRTRRDLWRANIR